MECQKTIESLGRQLKSLATLEDFLIDTSTIPGFSARLSSNDAFNDSDDSKTARDSIENGNNNESSPPSALSTNHATAAKSRNGFGKFFSKSKSVIEVNHRQE